MKIKQVKIMIFLLYYALFKIYIIPTGLQQITKIASVFIVILFLLTNFNLKSLFNISVPFSMVVILSGVYSYFKNINDIGSMMDGILYAICLYCICTLLIYCSEKNYIESFVNIFFSMSVLYCIFSLMTILIYGVAEEGATIYYFAGNKFSTGYLFIMTAALFFVKYHEKININLFYRVINIFLCLTAIAVCLWIHCATASIAAFFVLIFTLMSASIRQGLKDWRIFLIVIFASTILVFGFEKIISIPQIQNIVVNVLDKDLTMTGRKGIYHELLTIIQKSKWFGYGYGNTIVSEILGYGNAQNGLFQIIVNYGIIGCIVFIATIIKCTQKATVPKYDGLYALAYAMIIASIVEISFNYQFFFALFGIYAVSNSQIRSTIKRNNI